MGGEVGILEGIDLAVVKLMGNLNWQVESLGEETCVQHLFHQKEVLPISSYDVHCTSFDLQVIL